MNSESIAKVLGGMIAVFVLGAAVVYGPLGQFGKSAQSPQKTDPVMPQKPPAATPPGFKGPVIREVSP